MSSSTNSFQTKFDYRKFESLTTHDLVVYMESILNDPTTLVDLDDLRSVVEGFDSFDEYHLVYGIELGMYRLPSLFAFPTARCLSHGCQSVRLAAHRSLSHLASEEITDDLIDACRAAIASGAPLEEVGDLPDLLRRRQKLSIG